MHSSDKQDARKVAAVQPRFVSQLNVESVAGINPRRFLEVLPRLGVPVVSLGKLRLVRLDDLEAALLRASGSAEATGDGDAIAQPLSAADVLARLGRRQTAGAR